MEPLYLLFRETEAGVHFHRCFRAEPDAASLEKSAVGVNDGCCAVAIGLVVAKARLVHRVTLVPSDFSPFKISGKPLDCFRVVECLDKHCWIAALFNKLERNDGFTVHPAERQSDDLAKLLAGAGGRATGGARTSESNQDQAPVPYLIGYDRELLPPEKLFIYLAKNRAKPELVSDPRQLLALAGCIAADFKWREDSKPVEVNLDTGKAHVIREVDPPPPPPDPALFARYRQHLIDLCQFVPLRGINRREGRERGDPQQAAQNPDRLLELERIYIGLNSTQRRESPERAGMAGGLRQADSDAEFLPALELAAQHRQLVIHGGPGSGKSTFLRFFILAAAHFGLEGDARWIGRLPGWPVGEGALIPIRVELRHFEKFLRDNGKTTAAPGHLWDFIEAALRKMQQDFRVGDLAEPMEQALTNRQAIVFLDGLDEVPGVERKLFVRDCIEGFAGLFPRTRLVVTCRTRSYEADYNKRTLRLRDSAGKPWPAVELASFDAETQIPAFVKCWYDALAAQRIGESSAASPDAAGKIQAEHDQRARALQEALRGPALKELAPEPLLLTCIAHLHSSSTEMKLPENRAELFDDIIDLLLYRWAERWADDGPQETLGRLLADIPHFNTADFLHELAKLAFATFRGANQEASEIPESSLRTALMALHPALEDEVRSAWAVKVTLFIQYRAGLLNSPDGLTYAFPHSLFHEYLAALHLTLQDDSERKIAAQVTADGNWDEVVRLAAGNQVFVAKRAKDAKDIALALCDAAHAGQPVSELDWHKVALAADVVSEMSLIRLERLGSGGLECRERVRKLAAALLEAGALPARERARVGVILGALGDPRPGVACSGGGVPQIEWVEIPPGKFTMGGPEDWPGGTKKKFRPSIEKPYRISRYPVTVAQFRAFVEDGGYREPEFWKWSKAAEAFLGSVTGPQDDGNAVFQTPNHPRIGVSWFEAVAFCHWLNAKLLLPPDSIRLPSEAEWERSARGTDGREWPWGDDSGFEKHCNCHPSGIGHTSAVGLFPSGDTPKEGENKFGLADMSGNVWEWCRTQWLPDYQNYEKKVKVSDDLKGDSARVVRGGSWFFNDPRNLSPSYRIYDGPDVRGSRIGFRLVCGSVSAC